jgi:hypothetical protein
MRTSLLLGVIAVAELATGVGLVVVPSRVVELLLGDPLGAGVPLVVARVAGIALAAIGLVCWIEKNSQRGGSPTALLSGLLVYNCAIPVLLVHGYKAYQLDGIGLWPVLAMHVLFALWLAACLRATTGKRGSLTRWR